MSQTIPVCKFYLNNICRFGDRCRFSHDSGDYYETYDTDSSEDESIYVPSTRRFVFFKPERSDQDPREPFGGEKYGFGSSGRAVTSGLQRGPERYGFSTDERVVRRDPQRGLHKYGLCTDERAARHEPQQRWDKYGSNDHFRRNLPDHSASSNRYVGSSRSKDWQVPAYRPEEDLEERDSSSSSMEEIREIVDKIHQEAEQIQYDNMWPLTSLSVLKDGTGVPGWVDHSPEEMRMAAYSAKVSGCLDDYHAFYKRLMQEADSNRKTFLLSKKKAEDIVWDMLKQGNDGCQDIHSNNVFTSVPASCAFGSAVSSPFGSPGAPSVFGGVAATSRTCSASSNLSTASVFGYKMKNDPATRMCTIAAVQTSSNPFENAGSDCEMDFPSVARASGSAPAESSPRGNSSLFTENLFGKVPLRSPPKHTTSSIFTGTSAPAVRASILKGNVQSSNLKTDSGAEGSPRNSGDDGVYTPIEQLSQSDLEQFKATTFTLDKLPLVPPPRELC